MNGVPRALFLPLSLSIGFAMIISFLLAQTIVPIISNWLLKTEKFSQHAHAVQALDKEEVREINEHITKTSNVDVTGTDSIIWGKQGEATAIESWKEKLQYNLMIALLYQRSTPD